MPVYKFRTFEDAEKALWNFNPDEIYFAQIAELWAFADKLSRPIYPGGIFKFKSLDDANRHRDEVELKHARRVISTWSRKNS